MPNLTIGGQVFDVPEDPSIAPGVILTEGMASSLQQTRRENIRNNFSKRVSDALGDAETLGDDAKAELQAALNEYAAKYEFGVRAAGGGRRVVDPVEREARDMAKKDIAQAYFAKHGKRLTGEPLTEAAGRLLEIKGEDYMRRARRIIADRERAGEDLLAQTGLGEVQAEAAE